jgi:type IV pilus assembly protein PilP
MKTPCAILVSFAIVMGVAAFNWGCDSGSKAPTQPKIVRKKIVDDTAAGPASAKARRQRPGSASSPPEPKSDTVATQSSGPDAKKPAAPVAGPAAPEPKSDVVATSPVPSRPEVVARRSDPGEAKQRPESTATRPEPSSPQKEAPAPPKPQAPRPTVTAPAGRPPSDSGPAAGAATTAEIKEKQADQKKPAGDADPEPYNPAGKIDPFEPLYKDEPEIPATRQNEKKRRIPRTPLEKIDLGQLKLVGIIMAPSGNRAMVQEASGKGYIIKEGTYIGLNSGRVVQIQQDRVIIEEEIEDIVGKFTTRKKEIVLPKPPGE